METARGCWKMAEKRTPDYLFATNNSIIRGVYKIKEIKSVLAVNIEEKENDFRKFPTELKDRELKVIKQLEEYPDVDSIEELPEDGADFKELIDNDKSDSRDKKEKDEKEEAEREKKEQEKKDKSLSDKVN
jgi:hypothetical protein